MDNEIFEIMQRINVKQVIFQGPPGTSKTHGAKELIKKVIGKTSTLEVAKLTSEDYKSGSILNRGNVYWDMVQFHPSYSYEDFVRGITVSTESGDQSQGQTGQIKYETVNKIFGAICELAGREYNKNNNFFLIIDEINRADVATVLGELIYALEYRGENNKISTPYSIKGERNLCVPDNLYIIGTMNTADKSVGTIDMAIRRRFLFVDLLPDEEVINTCFGDVCDSFTGNEKKEKICDIHKRVIHCFAELKEIVTNACRGNYKPKDFMIGHTYFLPPESVKTVEEIEECIKLKIKYQVLPMLREYAEDRIIGTDEIKKSKTNYDNLIKYLNGDDATLDNAVDELMA